jgi:hypothetical protein
MAMKEATAGMTQAMEILKEASRVDDDEVTIAADDAGATAAMQKIETALEVEHMDAATPATDQSGDRTQQTTSLIGRAPVNAAASLDKELIKKARENTRMTDDMIDQSGFENERR